MLIGYARVSTIQQNLERQLDALKIAGCEKIYSEKVSGKSMKDRPELDKAINAMQPEDVLVVAEWDRATRSMMDGIAIMQNVHKRGGFIKVLDKKDFDLTTATGRGLMALLSSIAEDERVRIVRRAEDGRKQARKNGVKFGRKDKLSPEQKNMVKQLRAEGKSTRYIGKAFNVSIATVSRTR